MNIQFLARFAGVCVVLFALGRLPAGAAARSAASINAELQKLNDDLVMFDTFDISMLKPLPPDMSQDAPQGPQSYMVVIPSRQRQPQMYATDRLLAALKRRVALLREFEQADPQDKDSTEAQVESQIARLAVLEDKETLKELNDAASGKDPAAERARMTLALRDWLARKDVASQRAVLDRVRAEAKAQSANDDVARTLVNMSRDGAADPKLAQEAIATVSTALKGPYAAAIRSTPNKLNAPLTVAGTTVEGQTLSTAQWRGKVVMVDFWATWCVPCRAEMPHIVSIYNKYHAQGLEILGVSNDPGKLELVEFLKQHPEMKWPHLFGPSSSPNHWNRITERFHIPMIPAVYLIDRNGVFRAEVTAERMEETIEQLLTERFDPLAAAPTPDASEAPPPNAPAAPAPRIAEAPPSANAPTVPSPARISETSRNEAASIEKAESALSLARAYISAHRYEVARSRLQKIIADYPKTSSAKEAKTLLDQIADK